jgi:hypothetical protein
LETDFVNIPLSLSEKQVMAKIISRHSFKCLKFKFLLDSTTLFFSSLKHFVPKDQDGDHTPEIVNNVHLSWF